MEVQLDRDAGADAPEVDGAARASRCTSASRRPGSSATAPSPACSSRTARRSSATWSSSPPASARTSPWPRRAGLDDQARHRRRRRHGDRATRRSAPSASAPSTAAWSTAWWRRSGSRRRVLADRLTGRAEDKIYEGSRISTKLKVMGVDLAVMGEKQSRDADDEVVHLRRARPRRLPEADRPRRQAGRRDPARRHLRRRRRCSSSSIAARALPGCARLAALPDSARRQAPAVGRRSARTTRRSATATASRRARSSARCAPAARPSRRCATPPAPAPAAARARCRSRRSSRPWPATTCRRIPAAHYYVPGVPLAKRELIAAITEMNLRSVSQVFDVLADGTEDPGSKAGLASLLKTIWGTDVRRRARRALHQRPRPRQHPEGPHLQRRAAHLRRRDHRRRPAPDRRRRRQVQRAAW